ncbi:hypothetical protein GE09DRAFT_1073516 [Coniochaeta sp. 2T2.1]|nr:hypothetical protein GE09DRAFT_1073516 [Coniochaeta sp. 2T2.1]
MSTPPPSHSHSQSQPPSPGPEPQTTAQEEQENDEAAAMAAMMGFSSFGSQAPPSKKRRYNPRADAVLSDSTLPAPSSSLPSKPPAPKDRGTGANMMPLLARPVNAATGGGQGGVEAEGGLNKNGKRGSTDAGTAAGEGGEEEQPAPRYIDTSLPPSATTGGEGGEEEEEEEVSLPVTGAAFTQHQSAASRGGGGGKRIWYADYYDPSSNENPWEWLEKARGLEPVGSWLPRGHASGRAGGRN